MSCAPIAHSSFRSSPASCGSSEPIAAHVCAVCGAGCYQRVAWHWFTEPVPDDDRSPRVSAPAKVAAGPRSVIKSLRTALGAMGPVRSARTLRRVNQKDGFACPACAWPESKDQHVADFCEQGVK